MDAALLIRLYDTDGMRLTQAEKHLREKLHAHGVSAEVETVACHLEMGRQGLFGQEPVLQVNGYTVSASVPLTHAMLEDCCRRLGEWQRVKQSS